jgi:2-hydroxy-6-oxonona-2,4-dienedioate hydrolase
MIAKFLGIAAVAALASACETIPEATKASQRVLAQTLEVNGAELYCRTYGAGDRAVVFLQGAQLPCEMWEVQAKALAKHGWKVIAYDVRGFGKSSPVTEPFSHENDLRVLLDQLGIDRTALVGLSLGGRIAIEFAVEHPERVDALVLVGPGLPGFPFDLGDPPWQKEIRAAVEAGDGARAARAWLESGFLAPAMENPSVASRVRELALANARVWLEPDQEFPIEPPAIGRLSTIKIPTLVVAGSRDVPPILAIADHLEREIPGAHKAMMAGCGHVPNLERPEEFDRIVRQFLESVR